MDADPRRYATYLASRPKTAEDLARGAKERRSSFVSAVVAAGAVPPAELAHTLSAALALALCAEAPELCVIGGAEVYAQALPLAHALALTEVDAHFPEADCWFPPLPCPLPDSLWLQSATGLAYRFHNLPLKD